MTCTLTLLNARPPRTQLQVCRRETAAPGKSLDTEVCWLPSKCVRPDLRHQRQNRQPANDDQNANHPNGDQNVDHQPNDSSDDDQDVNHQADSPSTSRDWDGPSMSRD
ncbi:uncharacterized protein ACIQIH_000385 [Cyanocitta cristata]